MKFSWAAFKDSRALDARDGKMGSNPQTYDELHQLLSEPLLEREVTEDQHRAIMNAVRGARIMEVESAARTWLPRAAFTLGAAAMVLLTAWIGGRGLVSRPKDSGTPLSSASQVLALGESVSIALPKTTEPLTRELELVNQDVQRTADFFFASLP